MSLRDFEYLNPTSPGSFSGDVTIAGDLTVDGTTTTINSTTVTIDDKNILLNDGGTTAGTTGAGIDIEGDSAAVVGYMRVASGDNSNLEFKAPGNAAVLTIDIDATETLTVGGSLNIEADSLINQDLTSDSTAAQFADLTLTNDLLLSSGSIINFNSGDVTLTHAANSLAVEGGDVGIGQASVGSLFEVGGTADNQVATFRSTDNIATIGFADNTTTLGGGVSSYVGIGANGDDLILFTNNVEVIRVDTTGTVGINKSSSLDRNLNIEDTTGVGGGQIGLTTDTSGTSDNLGRIHFGNATDNSIAAIFGTADGAADAGRLTFLTESTGSTIEERMRIDSSGNVGIGTTSPDGLLHLKAASSHLIIEDSDVASLKHRIIGGGNAGLEIAADFNDAVAGSYIRFDVDSAEAMRIDEDGKVGIGTSSPESYLDVSASDIAILVGADNGATSRTNVTSKTARVAGYHYTNSEEPFTIFYSVSNSTANEVRIGGGTGTLNAATELKFYTTSSNTTLSGTERMRIDSSGNVGIGQASVGAPFEVGNQAVNQVAVFRSTDSISTIGFADDSTTLESSIYSHVSIGAIGDDLALFTSNSESMRIDSAGKVGIGVTPLTNMAAGDLVLEGGSLALKEITTPTADANYGKVYTKTDNELYFQDGAGTESQISNQGGGGGSIISTLTSYSSSTTSEDTIWTFTVPGGTLGTAGGIIGKAYVTGHGASTTTTVRLKYGSTTLATSVINMNNTGSDTFTGSIDFTLFATGATGTQRGGLRFEMGGSAANGASNDHVFGNSSAGTSSEDSTGDLAFTLTIQSNSGFDVQSGVATSF